MSMSNGGNLVIISSMADSSVGSNNSVQTWPIDDLHFQTATHNTSVVSYIVMLLGLAPPHTLGEDMLAAALLDMRLVVIALISLCWFVVKHSTDLSLTTAARVQLKGSAHCCFHSLSLSFLSDWYNLAWNSSSQGQREMLFLASFRALELMPNSWQWWWVLLTVGFQVTLDRILSLTFCNWGVDGGHAWQHDT
jgi:hypothetical protein